MTGNAMRRGFRTTLLGWGGGEKEGKEGLGETSEGCLHQHFGLGSCVSTCVTPFRSLLELSYESGFTFLLRLHAGVFGLPHFFIWDF